MQRMEKADYEQIRDCLVIHVGRDLDHHIVQKIRGKADYYIQKGNVKHIIFDFEDVDFMDSSGIGLIMGRYKKVIFYGGKTAVVGVGENVDRIFQLSGLYKIIEKYEDICQAVENL